MDPYLHPSGLQLVWMRPLLYPTRPLARERVPVEGVPEWEHADRTRDPARAQDEICLKPPNRRSDSEPGFFDSLLGVVEFESVRGAAFIE